MSKPVTIAILVVAVLALVSSDGLAIGFGSGGSGGPPPKGGRVLGVGSGPAPGTPPPSAIPWSSPEPPSKPTGPKAPGTPPSPGATPTPSADAGKPTPTPSGDAGKPTPKPTPSTDPAVTVDGAEAGEPLKPTLLFFAKYAVSVKPGVVAKDEAVKATLRYFREVFRAEEIVALAREFRCILVDVRKLKKITSHIPFRTGHAPTLRLLDRHEKTLYRTMDPNLTWQVLAVKMKAALKKVEAEVKKIARSREVTPLVERAKARVAEIAMREEYNKGFSYLLSMRWSLADSRFRKLLRREGDSPWKDRARRGLKEIEAGKLVAQAQRALQGKQMELAKDLLRQAMEIKEARHFGKKARELYRSL